MDLRRLLAVTAAFLLTAPPALGAPQDGVLYQETFAGASTAPDVWLAKGACLTAADRNVAGQIPACPGGPLDPDGEGALRLTGNAQDQAGFALYSEPLYAGMGASVEFDMYQYDMNTKGWMGADGLSFFLVDGAASPTEPGRPGAGLGYKDLRGGFFGIGFDEYGNFLNPGAWTGGENVRHPNTIGVRGAVSAGQKVLAKAVPPKGETLAVDGAGSRERAKRHVQIRITPDNLMTVDVDYGHGPVRQIDDLKLTGPGQPALPATFKLGFAASTGAKAAVHEIGGLFVRSLKPNLHAELLRQTEPVRGGSVRYLGRVRSSATSPPAVVRASAVIAGARTATGSGDGWSCVSAGNEARIDCVRADGKPLPGNAELPPIVIDAVLGPDASGDVRAVFNATTRNEYDPADNLAVDSAPVPPGRPAGPDLSTTLTAPEGGFVTGRLDFYTLKVSAAAEAGPTHGPVTEIFAVPPGQTPMTADGDGWTCDITDQTVACVSVEQVFPGDRYAPIVVEVMTGDDAVAPLRPSASVSTEGDTDPGNDVSAGQEVVVVPDGLSVGLEVVGDAVVGAKETVAVTVTNARGAEPTYEQVNLVYSVPEGSKPRSAAGDGWDCTVSRWTVTCNRPGAGTDTLRPGTSYPPVQIVSATCPQWRCVKQTLAASVVSGELSDTVSRELVLQRRSELAAGVKATGTSPVTFTVQVTNAGPSDVDNALLSVALPEGFKASGPWVCDAGKNSACPAALTATGGLSDLPLYLASSGSVTLTLTGTPPAGGVREPNVLIVPPAGVRDGAAAR